MTPNDVKRAIYNMGGPTKAGITLRVSTNTVHKWIKNGVIPNVEKAEQVAEASGFEVSKLRPTYSPAEIW